MIYWEIVLLPQGDSRPDSLKPRETNNLCYDSVNQIAKSPNFTPYEWLMVPRWDRVKVSLQVLGKEEDNSTYFELVSW